jgi:hypothetical protein
MKANHCRLRFVVVVFCLGLVACAVGLPTAGPVPHSGVVLALAGPAPAQEPPPPGGQAVRLSAAPDAASPTYPGDRVAIQFIWTRSVGPGVGFVVEIRYPFPHVTFVSATPGNHVESCEHVVADHLVRCTGAFPGHSPPQSVTGDFILTTESTCSLYDDPRSELSYEGHLTYSDGQAANYTHKVAVAPPLELTVLVDTPREGAKDVKIKSGGQGPLLKWHDYMSGYKCGPFPFPDFSDIYYNTYIRQAGGSWKFLTGWTDCSRQVQLGPDELSCLADGEPAPYEWRVDAVDVKYQSCRQPGKNVFHFTTGSCRPEVKVKPQYEKYFLTGLAVDNNYRAEVHWAGTAYDDPTAPPYGQVLFDLNGTVSQVTGEEWGAEKTYNMGTDFQAGLGGGNNVLSISAVNAEGGQSQPVVLQPMVFPVPAWITQFTLGNFQVNLQAMTVKYARELEYPDPHFSAQCHVPDWVPYLGGANMGIVETYATVGAEACSDGSGAASVSGHTGVQVTDDKKITGGVSGAGNVRIGPPSGLDLTAATFGLNVKGEISQEMGIADLVPGLKTAEGWPIVGRLVKWFNRRATVEAAIGPEVQIVVEFKDVNDVLTFDSGKGTGLLDMALTLTLRVLDSLKGSVTGGGTPRVVVHVPAAGAWGYLQEIAIDLYAKATLTVWRFEKEWQIGTTCSLPAGVCKQSEEEEGVRAERSTWQLMGRDYVGPGYARFTAGSASPSAALGATQETQLVSDVFPLADPALAVRGDGERLVLWVHDDPAKPIGQGEEIRSAYWNGLDWSTASLTSDNYEDFNPQVVYDAVGNGVAAWERTNTVHVTSTLSVTYARSFEIAWATWNGSAWSTPTLLTSNALLDSAPQLARGQDGTVMALWRSGDGTDLMGTITHPVTLTYAVWNGSGWTASAVAAGGLAGLLDVDLAVRSSGQAALVLATDVDGDPLTGGDAELFYATWDGTAWSALAALTSDAIADTAPALAYNAAGQPVIVWLRGDPAATPDLVMQSGWAGTLTSVRPDATSGAFLDFKLAADSSGNLGLLWQAYSDVGADAAFALYDVANSSWGAGSQLTSDDSLEESFAPALADDGTLYVAYDKVAMEWVTETVDISPTLTILVSHVPQPVQTDLYLLSHAIERDLGIGSGDLAFSASDPAPGSSVVVSATVHNLGDLAVTGGQVAFYDGDPGAGGIQIGATQALASPFRAAMTDTVHVTWDVPPGNVPHTVFAVVDPSDAIAEADESNNTASRGAVLPDLAVAWAHSTHSTEAVTLTATITNGGHSTVPASPSWAVAFRAEDPTLGPLLGTVGVGSAVAPGGQATVTLALDDPASLAGVGTRFWAVADSASVVVEADEDNNAGYAALDILPDLTLAAPDIRGDGPITVTVHNVGVLTATGVVTLTVWQDAPGGTVVYHGVLGTIGPGASAHAVLDLPPGQVELWAKVDPDNEVAESDESNNLAACRRVVLARVYLPLIMRQAE